MVAVSPISSLISAGMQILPFESTLTTCSIFSHNTKWDNQPFKTF